MYGTVPYLYFFLGHYERLLSFGPREASSLQGRATSLKPWQYYFSHFCVISAFWIRMRISNQESDTQTQLNLDPIPIRNKNNEMN